MLMKGKVSPFPWDAVMAFGLGTLKLSQDAFWRTTPREISAAFKAYSCGASTPPTRSQLDTLMTRYPDHPKDKSDLHE